MPTKCVYKDCNSESDSNSKLCFHKLPLTNRQRLREWVKRSGNDYLINEKSRICSKHFNKDDYVSKASKRLKEYSVPHDYWENHTDLQMPVLKKSIHSLSSRMSVSSTESTSPTAEDKKKTPRSFPGKDMTRILKRPRLEQNNESILNSSTSSNSTLPTPWEWRSIKRENSSLKTQLTHGETTVQELDKIRQEMEEIFAKEKKIFENQAELDRETIEKLELRLKDSLKSSRETRESLSSLKSNMYQTKMKAEQKTMALIAENSEIQLKFESAEDLITELKEKLNEKNNAEEEIEVQKIELQNAKLKIKNLESEKKRANDLEKKLKQANKTISSMKESEKKVQILKEQISILEETIKRLEIELSQVTFIKTEPSDLIAETPENQVNGFISPPFNCELDPLEQNEIPNIDSLTREHGILKSKYNETKKLSLELKSSNEKLKQFVSRLQIKMNLVVRERDSYRQQLNLYENEILIIESNTGEISAMEKSLNDSGDLLNELKTDSEEIVSKEQYEKLRNELNRLENNLENQDFPDNSNYPTRILQSALLEKIEKSRIGEKSGIRTADSSLQVEEIADSKESSDIRKTRLKEAFKVTVDLLENTFSATLEELCEHHP